MPLLSCVIAENPHLLGARKSESGLVDPGMSFRGYGLHVVRSVPEALDAQHARGETPDLKISPEEYINARSSYRETGERDRDVLDRA